jgi:hypothetical protein
MNDYALVLTVNYPGTIWVMNGDTYDTLEWLDENTPKPTKAALEKQLPEAEYKKAVKENDSLRRQAYTLESDPLFFQWQRGESTEQAWKNKVEEIQQRYPEPVKAQ